jgi:hypothetical protein
MLLLLLALAVGARADSSPQAGSASASQAAECAAGGGVRGMPPTENDADCDHVNDDVDNCPGIPNGDQANADGDPYGDRCDGDDDEDGVYDTAPDNCRTVYNPGQEDSDGDGIGDACVKDTDADGRIDPRDNCPGAANPDQRDTDGDTYGDACDNDDDEDYVFDTEDNCPLVINQSQTDRDGDGRGAACDPDDDAGAAEAGPGGPGAGSSDRTPPQIAVRVGRRHRLAAVAGGLVVKLRCSEACAAIATLVADRRTARALRLARSRVAATAGAEVAREATTYAFLRFPKTVKRRLWRRPATRLTLRVEAVDRAGNKRAATRRITLTRSSSRRAG